MAASIFRIVSGLQRISTSHLLLVPKNSCWLAECSRLRGPLQGDSILKEQVRSTSFLITLTADQLWKGVTSVSNAGRKRGRGKGAGRVLAKNLNRGQVIGIGKSNMVWPGLNTPIIKGKEIMEMKQLPPDPKYEEKLLKIRDDMQKLKALKISPLERGWSGRKMPGRSSGAPDPIGEDTFEGFDTKVLEFKTVMNMSGTAGRVKRFSCFSVTGNGNGIGGFALAKASEGKAAIKKSKNRAAQKLVHIERFNEHTINHNFFAQYGRTKIFAFKKPEGFGLVCHRALKTICQTVGIKNMYAKVEGNTKNIQNLTKAFFHGLINQKTHQQMANEVGLNVVEFRPENDFFPTLIASPNEKQPPELQEKKQVDFQEYISGGNVVLRKKKWPPFYVGTKGWEMHLKRTLFVRNHKKVIINTLIEEGERKSFLANKSPAELPKIIGVGKPQFSKA